MAEPIRRGNRFSGWPPTDFTQFFRSFRLTHGDCKRMLEFALLM